jgi:hypothetical protein
VTGAFGAAGVGAAGWGRGCPPGITGFEGARPPAGTFGADGLGAAGADAGGAVGAEGRGAAGGGGVTARVPESGVLRAKGATPGVGATGVGARGGGAGGCPCPEGTRGVGRPGAAGAR